MGIRGLAHYLRQRAPAAYTNVTAVPKECIERWALDCSCIMYRARASSLHPVTVIASLICKLRNLGVELIVIFDGKPPAVKAATLEERKTHRTAVQKEIDSLDPSGNEIQIEALQRKIPTVSASDKDAVKQLLYAAGVLFLNATGEADDLLAALYKQGDVTAVISTDMDMLPRGIGRVIIPETADASILTSVSLDRILSSLSLTYDQFVAACCLMGTDYSERSMNPQQAVTAIQSGRSPVKETDSSRQLKGDGVTLTALLTGAQEEKWIVGAPPVEPEALAALAVTYGWPPGWIATLLTKLTAPA